MPDKKKRTGEKKGNIEKKSTKMDNEIEYYKIPGTPDVKASKMGKSNSEGNSGNLVRPSNATFTTYAVILTLVGVPELVAIIYFGSLLDSSYRTYILANRVCCFSLFLQPLIIMKVISVVLLFSNRNYKLAGVFLIVQGSILLLLNISINVIEFFFIYNTYFLLCLGGFFLIFISILTIILGISVLIKGKKLDEFQK
jgi:hypothetical protein